MITIRSFLFISLIFITHHSFGQQNEMLQRLFYEKTPTGWLLKTKEDYTYNAAHQLIAMISLDTSEQGWTNRLKKDLAYSPLARSHQRIEIVREGKDSTWSDPMHTLFLQDPNGHDAMSISTDYDSTETIGILHHVGFFTLDAEGRPIEKRYVQPQDQGWLNQDLTTLTYIHSNLDTEVYAVWETNAWQQRNKTRYYYSPDQRLDHTEIYTRDKTTGAWSSEPSTLAWYTYDADNHLVEYRIQKKRSGVWTDVFKRVSVWGTPQP